MHSSFAQSVKLIGSWISRVKLQKHKVWQLGEIVPRGTSNQQPIESIGLLPPLLQAEVSYSPQLGLTFFHLPFPESHSLGIAKRSVDPKMTKQPGAC